MTTQLIKVTDKFHVAPQITAADVPAFAAEGVTLIVNNRPDGEAPDQPPGDAIARAAAAAGVSYIAIPVGGSGISPDMLEDFATALSGNSGETLAFCRSGTRSITLWAFAEAARGANPDALIEAAAAAGYDLAPWRGAFIRLAESPD